MSQNWSRELKAIVVLGVALCAGCSQPTPPKSTTTETPAEATPTPVSPSPTPTPSAPRAVSATAKPEEVKVVRERMAAIAKSTVSPKDGDLLTEIVIQDGSPLTADDITMLGKLSDLTKLQIFNCRTMNDEMAAQLLSLKGLKSLALTNTVITDATVEAIAKSLPGLTDLDLSSNTNMSSKVVRILSENTKLQRLTLVQNKVNDIGARRLKSFQELRALDLRGNMEAGDMALEVIAELPKLSGFKHRSTAVSDAGMEYLGKNQTLDSLLIQDFNITDQSGPHLAKLGKLTQLEVFRCQGFGSSGLLALNGMGLTRLTLRDLPNVKDEGMAVFANLPKLKRLYLHELTSVTDAGLKHLESLKTLEQLDIWTVPMTDATIDVIATLPHLKDLSLRTTNVTDAAVDKLLAMPQLQSLRFKENGSVTAEGMKKLTTKKWAKLDTGTSSGGSDPE